MAVFANFLATNTLKTAKVVVTPLMVSLLKDILKEDGHRRYLILGPHGSGKTTTLYWLYNQLKKRQDDPVGLINIMNAKVESLTEVPDKKYYCCDLNSIAQLDPKQCHNLGAFFNWILMHDKSYLILATTSAFIVSNKRFGILRQTYETFLRYSTDPFDEELTTQLFSQLGVEHTQEIMDNLMEYCHNIPGFLSLYYSAKGDWNQFKEFAETRMYAYLSKVLDQIDTVDYDDTFILLTAVLCKAPVTNSKFSKPDYLLPLIQGNIVYLKDDNVPKLYVNISDKFLHNLIASFSRSKKLTTDAESALGFIFEHQLRQVFIGGFMVKARCATSEAEVIFTLPRMMPMQDRISHHSDSHTLTVGQLWQTPKGMPSVDYVGMCKIRDFVPDVVYLAVQASIQKKGIRDKIEQGAKTIPNFLKTAAEGKDLIYLFINPIMTKTFDELFGYFQTAKKPLSTRSKKTTAAPVKYWLGVPYDYSPFHQVFECVEMLLKP